MDNRRAGEMVFWGLFVLLSLVSLVPLWSVRIVPMQDVWQHLALVDVIHNFDAPGSVYPDYFVLPTTPKPNLAYYYVTSWLGYLFPLEIANKVVLSGYVLAFPLSFLFLMRSFGRSKWLTLFSFPMIYNAMFAYGFVAFLLGMPLLMVGVGAYRRFLDSPPDAPFNLDGLFAAIAVLAAFFVHAHIYLLMGMLIFTLWILHRPKTLWGLALRTWPVIPSLVFFIPWFLVYFVRQKASTSGMTFGSLDKFFNATYYKSSYVVNNFFHFINDYFRSDWDDALFLVLMLVFLVLMMGRKAPRIREGADRKMALFDLEVLTLVLAVSVMALPEHIKAQSIVSLRHIPFTVLFFFGWVGFEGMPKRVTFPAVALLVFIQLATVANLRKGFREVATELDDFPSVFRNVDGGKRMLKVLYNQESRTTDYGAFWHLHSFYMIERGGITDVAFAEYPHNPVQFRPGMVPPKVPVNFTGSPAWRYYDYVLMRKSSMPNIRSVRDVLEPVGDVADWIMYRVSLGPLPRSGTVDSVPAPRRGGPESIPEGRTAAERKPATGSYP